MSVCYVHGTVLGAEGYKGEQQGILIVSEVPQTLYIRSFINPATWVKHNPALEMMN